VAGVVKRIIGPNLLNFKTTSTTIGKDGHRLSILLGIAQWFDGSGQATFHVCASPLQPPQLFGSEKSFLFG
jgi:hypothetical protein